MFSLWGCFQDVELGPPPTLSSGYGVLEEKDFTLTPVEVLNKHETTVKQWLFNASPDMLKACVDTCRSHASFSKFKFDLWDSYADRKFGVEPAADVLQFDLWLKKHELSERMPSKTATLTSPSSTTTSSEIPPPANPEAYKEYWSQFKSDKGILKRQNAGKLGATPSRESLASTAATPSPPPAPLSTPSPANSGLSSGITPDCKRKLSLEGYWI